MTTKQNEIDVTVTLETSWKRALNAARRTDGKEPIDKEPSDAWKAASLLSEHSQIKLVEYLISFRNLRQWVGVHFIRHEHVLPFIHSQRGDRRELPCKRDDLPQGEPNDQDFVVNAQTLINMSRKRLCRRASKETRDAWEEVRKKVGEIDPVMADKMVPNCVYSGFCREKDTCGYAQTKEFNMAVEEYRYKKYE
ncbi:MAG: FAD-dependent thymidylate synthase [Paludibacteraceae bacterium]|nr:FAD-dependent thymidylate synthase [Paludibacteraceae bacterium]